MALVLNGTSQYGTLAGAFGNSDADRSVALFIKPNAVTALGFPFLLTDDAEPSTLNYFAIRQNFNAGAEIAGQLKTSIFIGTSYTAIADDTWIPVVLTHNNATGTLTAYVGSTTGNSVSGADSGYTFDTAIFGARKDAADVIDYYFKGKIAYARAWSRILTTQEISDYINATTAAEIDAISATGLQISEDLVSAAGGVTLVGSPTFDADEPFTAFESVSDTTEIVPDTANGYGAVQLINPNTTDESSVAFGTTAVTGDWFEWHDLNGIGNLDIDAEGFVTNADTAGLSFNGRFWDATDSTWGTTGSFNTANASLPTPINLGVTNLKATSVRLTWQEGT